MAYTVSAALMSERDCIHTGDYWELGAYDTVEEASNAWNIWWPPREEVWKACLMNGTDDEYTLNIGIYDESGEPVDLWVEAVDI